MYCIPDVKLWFEAVGDDWVSSGDVEGGHLILEVDADGHRALPHTVGVLAGHGGCGDLEWHVVVNRLRRGNQIVFTTCVYPECIII